MLVGVPSDLPISGYGGRTVNFVRLYSAAASDEFDMQIFNAGDYMKAVEQKMVSETISKVLYPSDAVAGGPRTAAAAGVFLRRLRDPRHHARLSAARRATSAIFRPRSRSNSTIRIRRWRSRS